MRRWVAGAAVLASLWIGSAAHAQSPEPYRKVARSHWAYASVHGLAQRGYFTGSPGTTFSGKQELTRYEFAVAVEKLYRDMQPRILGATATGQLREDVARLRSLLKEFGPDVAGLGPDVAEIERQVQAMDERLARLDDRSGPRIATGTEMLADRLQRPRAYGFHTGLIRPLLRESDAATRTPDLTRLPFGPSKAPGLGTNLGPVGVAFSVQPPDPLTRVAGLPLESPSAGMNYGAQITIPAGEYLLLRAYYDREEGLSDRYALWDLPSGPVETLGGTVSGSLGERLTVEFQAASIRSLMDDLDRTSYFTGGVRYDFGSGFKVGVGYQRARQLGAPAVDAVNAAYVLRLERSLGRHSWLGLLYRLDATSSADGVAGSDAGNATAVTQFSIRF